MKTQDVKTRLAGLVAVGMTGFMQVCMANNLAISNTTVIASTPPAGTAYVQFDISWDNSWRSDMTSGDGYFHDATWVFFKVRPEGFDDWRHVVLATAGTNPAGFSTGTADKNVELVVSSDRMGVFVRRSAANTGSGTVASTNVTVRWSLRDSGISPSHKVELRAFAMEMVHVAEGAFWVGDGSADSALALTKIVTGDPTVAATLVDGVFQGGRPNGQSAPSTADWPNGYRAFYCMKYEVTQGAYADFLNTLSADQLVNRQNTGTANRMTLSVASGVYSATRPDRACNYIAWMDGVAFGDWAGLRPMTEMEYEKACRGPLYPVTDEFSWGTDTLIPSAALTIDGPEDGTETIATPLTSGAAVYGNTTHLGTGDGGKGPLRAGIFATYGTDRVSAGASYWGIMELSGNVWERVVRITQLAGRAYTGAHGDGLLTFEGHADVTNWPALIVGSFAEGSGVGMRGGHAFTTVINDLRVSNNNHLHDNYWSRAQYHGWRGVRTAP